MSAWHSQLPDLRGSAVRGGIHSEIDPFLSSDYSDVIEFDHYRANYRNQLDFVKNINGLLIYHFGYYPLKCTHSI